MLRDHIEEIVDQGHCQEFVKNKAMKEEPVEKKNQGKSDWYELTDEEEDWRIVKKPTLSINYIYEGQEALEGK
ncbi:unnamed protein product [Malus baccata var. baccata]